MLLGEILVGLTVYWNSKTYHLSVFKMEAVSLPLARERGCPFNRLYVSELPPTDSIFSVAQSQYFVSTEEIVPIELSEPYISQFPSCGSTVSRDIDILHRLMTFSNIGERQSNMGNIREIQGSQNCYR